MFLTPDLLRLILNQQTVTDLQNNRKIIISISALALPVALLSTSFREWPPVGEVWLRGDGK